jgi:hypothetical protein
LGTCDIVFKDRYIVETILQIQAEVSADTVLESIESGISSGWRLCQTKRLMRIGIIEQLFKKKCFGPSMMSAQFRKDRF